jgi:hypothetical protein
MAMWRWTHDQSLGFPPPIKIRNRNFRSRRALEDFKQNLLRKALPPVGKDPAAVARGFKSATQRKRQRKA